MQIEVHTGTSCGLMQVSQVNVLGSKRKPSAALMYAVSMYAARYFSQGWSAPRRPHESYTRNLLMRPHFVWSDHLILDECAGLKLADSLREGKYGKIYQTEASINGNTGNHIISFLFVPNKKFNKELGWSKCYPGGRPPHAYARA